MTLGEGEYAGPGEVCALCGDRMIRHRSDARFCGDTCRIEASRLRRLLAGETVGPYRSVADRLRAARSRTRTPLGGTDASWTTPTGEDGRERERSGVASHRGDAPLVLDPAEGCEG
jgi:hypothetical protein